MLHQQLATKSKIIATLHTAISLLLVYLQEARCLWTPFLFRTTMPSIQNTETYLQANKQEILNVL